MATLSRLSTTRVPSSNPVETKPEHDTKILVLPEKGFNQTIVGVEGPPKYSLSQGGTPPVYSSYAGGSGSITTQAYGVDDGHVSPVPKPAIPIDVVTKAYPSDDAGMTPQPQPKPIDHITTAYPSDDAGMTPHPRPIGGPGRTDMFPSDDAGFGPGPRPRPISPPVDAVTMMYPSDDAGSAPGTSPGTSPSDSFSQIVKLLQGFFAPGSSRNISEEDVTKLISAIQGALKKS